MKTSLLGEFNRAQQLHDRGTCSHFSAHSWLKANRPKHRIYPHQQDYCDTCAQKKNHSMQNKLHSTGYARLDPVLKRSRNGLKPRSLLYRVNCIIIVKLLKSHISITRLLPSDAPKNGKRSLNLKNWKNCHN